MKKIISLFVALFVFVAVGYAQKGVVKFAAETHDFGKVEQGKPVTHEFTFKNTGTEPVVITNAQASCGCTTPNWTREAVMPGKSGSVSATYNAAGLGGFNKSVTITNTGESASIVLYLKGEVVAKKEQTAATAPAAPAAKKKGV